MLPCCCIHKCCCCYKYNATIHCLFMKIKIQLSPCSCTNTGNNYRPALASTHKGYVYATLHNHTSTIYAFQLSHFLIATACQFVCCLVFYESYVHVIELLANANLKIGNFVIWVKTNITSFKCKWAHWMCVG